MGREWSPEGVVACWTVGPDGEPVANKSGPARLGFVLMLLHRTQIREALGFHPATRADEERLTAWLADEVCTIEMVEDRPREALQVQCRSDRVEPPACQASRGTLPHAVGLWKSVCSRCIAIIPKRARHRAVYRNSSAPKGRSSCRTTRARRSPRRRSP